MPCACIQDDNNQENSILAAASQIIVRNNLDNETINIKLHACKAVRQAVFVSMNIFKAKCRTVLKKPLEILSFVRIHLSASIQYFLVTYFCCFQCLQEYGT